MSKDKVLRPLFPSEIEEFTSRRGVDKIVVKDFLGSIEFSETVDVAIVNLSIYSKRYNWNKATRKAIEEVIKRAVKRPVKLK